MKHRATSMAVVRALRAGGALCVAGAFCAGSLATSCGGDQTTDYIAFVATYATAVCQRASECCASTDFAALHGADQTTCRQMFAVNADGIRQVFGTGLVRFDRTAGEACLAHIKTDACPLVYDPLPSDCPDIAVVGTRGLGSACDDDFSCGSGDCEGQRCVVRPAPLCDVCPAGEYCGVAGCTAVLQPGDACTSSSMCGDSGACVARVCAGLLDEGATCSSGRDCATNTCSNTVTRTATGTCRPALCQGT